MGIDNARRSDRGIGAIAPRRRHARPNGRRNIVDEIQRRQQADVRIAVSPKTASQIMGIGGTRIRELVG
jgi:hypothetical protein